MGTGRFEHKDNSTAIALIAADVEVVKGTTKEIKDQMVGFIAKCDNNFIDYNTRLVREETEKENIKDDIEMAHKRIDKVADSLGRVISSHEKSCPSREATLQRLVKPSRPPKDTPREMRKPEFANEIVLPTIPKWLWWTCIAIGVALATFAIVYAKFKTGL